MTVSAVVKLCCKSKYFVLFKALYVVRFSLASLGSLPVLQNFGFPNINHYVDAKYYRGNLAIFCYSAMKWGLFTCLFI